MYTITWSVNSYNGVTSYYYQNTTVTSLDVSLQEITHQVFNITRIEQAFNAYHCQIIVISAVWLQSSIDIMYMYQ